MTKSRGLRHRKNWTTDDLEFLCTMYPYRPTSEIATRLGRKMRDIHYKAGAMGLRKAQDVLKFEGKANWVPIGSNRLKGGFLERKVTHGQHTKNWEPVHHLVWKQAHGPIPKGHCVSFKQDRFTNVPELITLDRLELRTRQDIMRKVNFWSTSPELAKLYQLKGQITRQVRRIQEEAI